MELSDASSSRTLSRPLRVLKDLFTHDRSGVMWGIILKQRSYAMQRKDQVLDLVRPSLRDMKDLITHDRSGVMWGMAWKQRLYTIQRKGQGLDLAGPY